MKTDHALPHATADSSHSDMYHALGGSDTCRRLAVAFYARVEHDPVLRSVYPPITNFTCPIDTLTAFFIEFFGGPSVYMPRRWALSLREAHHRFAIGQRERDAWLTAIRQAIDEVNITEPARNALDSFFERAATFLINQPPEAGTDSPLSLEHHDSVQSEGETSTIHRDMEQRWLTLLTLEEMIAAVRQENAAVVLALLERPHMQTFFARDRAAFVSFLAIMSSSRQQILLDYVRRTLIEDPELIRVRYTTDRMLLHEVAGQGSFTIVEFLLQRGADPNATDQWERTPLYYVGNAFGGSHSGDVVRLLVQYGANVNAQEKLKHCTALHMAARRGTIPVAEALLDCGADKEARDKLGDTPLHRAVKCGKPEMVALLLSRGADVDAKGKTGLTPWQVARGGRIKELLQTFRA